jgi:hypothetical protein
MNKEKADQSVKTLGLIIVGIIVFTTLWSLLIG